MRNWISKKITEVFFYRGNFDSLRPVTGGNCPFHSYAPSFLVNPDRLEYFCMHCGTEGKINAHTYKLVDKVAKTQTHTEQRLK